MAGGIGLVVADIAVQPGLGAGVDQAHPVQPVGQAAPCALDASHIAMHDQPVAATGQVLGIVPAGQFKRLRLGRFLAVRGGGVGVAAVGAHQAVHHEL